MQFIWPHHIIHFLLFAISGIVFPQCPHQDHRHQAHQEDHHHEGVKYGEPVNLSVEGKMNKFLEESLPSSCNIVLVSKKIKTESDKTLSKLYRFISTDLTVLTLCWKKDGSRYLSKRSSNFTSDFFHFTYNNGKENKSLFNALISVFNKYDCYNYINYMSYSQACVYLRTQ